MPSTLPQVQSTQTKVLIPHAEQQKISIRNQLFLSFIHACETQGERAKYGLPKLFMWPLRLYRWLRTQNFKMRVGCVNIILLVQLNQF